MMSSRLPKRLPLYSAIVCLSPLLLLALRFPWAAHLAGSYVLGKASRTRQSTGRGEKSGPRSQELRALTETEALDLAIPLASCVLYGMSVSTYTNFQLFACKITRHQLRSHGSGNDTTGATPNQHH
ncbi:uncharacterized protein LOC116655797 [Drosophila ananassae]|uniref:uncharacterized protein LOC116655797 n=1 Tax=Drosophila ananassae TaxID=7217 RepID=UPI0013A5E6B5|nr:uncharacterized protein LOC116655797 [Drosophila ananassae]